jgi:DNA-binding transcriptional LysR family regulator
MELSAIDTNLLVALHALLQEASVTRAAKRLAIGQPAMSHALARLRDHFQDTLLVAKGRQLVLSPAAEALAPAVERAVAAMAEVFGSSPPKGHGAMRPFVLVCADHFGAAIVPSLLRRLGDSASRGLDVRAFHSRSTDRILEDADVALGSFEDLPATVSQRHLFSDPFVCVVRADHPQVRSTLTLRTYLKLSHVEVVPAPLARPSARVERALGARAGHRRVELWLTSYLLAARVLAETDLVLTLTRSLARVLQESAPLRIVGFPVEILPHRFSLIWHRRNDTDAVHTRLRNAVIDVCSPRLGHPR